MKLDNAFTALVIVGGWNKYIFTTDWIKRYLFPEEKDDLDVNARAEFWLMPGTQVVSQRISSKDVSIFLQGTRLFLTPVQNEIRGADRIEDIAIQLADYLPHTPVSGYGVNFGFTDINVSENLIKIMRPIDTTDMVAAGAQMKDEHYRRRLIWNGQNLNVTIGITGDVLALHFNFLFDIPDLAKLKSQITENPILALKQEAIEFISKIYGLEVEEDTK